MASEQFTTYECVLEGSLRKLVTRNSWSDRIDVEDETVDSVIRVFERGDYTNLDLPIERRHCRERMEDSETHVLIVGNDACLSVQNDVRWRFV